VSEGLRIKPDEHEAIRSVLQRMDLASIEVEPTGGYVQMDISMEVWEGGGVREAAIRLTVGEVAA
jgi:hypothetical protein